MCICQICLLDAQFSFFIFSSCFCTSAASTVASPSPLPPRACAYSFPPCAMFGQERRTIGKQTRILQARLMKNIDIGCWRSRLIAQLNQRLNDREGPLCRADGHGYPGLYGRFHQWRQLRVNRSLRLLHLYTAQSVMLKQLPGR